MTIQTIGQFALVKFDPGERYPEDFESLARAQKWRSGSIHAIGGVRGVTLAYYNLETHEYLKFSIEGIVELVSLMGNLTELEGAPLWHCHACVGDAAGNLKGGHLVSMTVALTLECWITPSANPVSRCADSQSGLNLLDLPSRPNEGEPA